MTRPLCSLEHYIPAAAIQINRSRCFFQNNKNLERSRTKKKTFHCLLVPKYTSHCLALILSNHIKEKWENTRNATMLGIEFSLFLLFALIWAAASVGIMTVVRFSKKRRSFNKNRNIFFCFVMFVCIQTEKRNEISESLQKGSRRRWIVHNKRTLPVLWPHLFSLQICRTETDSAISERRNG